MIVLGLTDSKPATAAILVDGRIVAAISEERLCRRKLASGMPRAAISAVMAEAGVTAKDVDRVAMATHTTFFQPEPVAWPGWFEDGSRPRKRAFEQLSSALAPIVGQLPIAWKTHHAIKRFASRDRLTKVPALLREAYGLTAPVSFFDHHYCHATSAYYTSNFDRALVVTLDGAGDGRSGSVYVGEHGRLREIASVDSFNSLGNMYSYVTALCGFKAEKHEGKITGLAAFGKPVYADILRQIIAYEEPGQIRYRVPMYYKSALPQLRERLPKDFDRADLAASMQLVLEEVGTTFVRYWLRKTGLRHIAVAGGVFSNVKFNQRVHELEGVDGFWVHPAMDDSGLSVGSALAALLEERNVDGARLVQRLPNVYFGQTFSSSQVEKAVLDSGCEAHYESEIQEVIARLLADGAVVARFIGRMEYGPRALGNRSIMYTTQDPSVNDWLNERLDRTEFMPFAPATLVEHAQSCFEGLTGAADPARFMTITFNCTPTMRTTSPGVVHVDGTARPQIVDPETSPDFYGILKAYHRLTGIPSLVNTSFNMHEEPIVCTPEDAIRSFQQGNLDYLAIENLLLTNRTAIAMQRTTGVGLRRG